MSHPIHTLSFYDNIVFIVKWWFCNDFRCKILTYNNHSLQTYESYRNTFWFIWWYKRTTDTAQCKIMCFWANIYRGVQRIDRVNICHCVALVYSQIFEKDMIVQINVVDGNWRAFMLMRLSIDRKMFFFWCVLLNFCPAESFHSYITNKIWSRNSLFLILPPYHWTKIFRGAKN